MIINILFGLINIMILISIIGASFFALTALIIIIGTIIDKFNNRKKGK